LKKVSKSGTQTIASPVSKECSLLFEFWVVQQATYPLIESAIMHSGLSSPDELGLYVLIDEYGSLTPGDIARSSGMRPNTVSVALNRIDRRGHLVRTPNPHDRRSVFIELSDDGRLALYTAAASVRRLEDRIGALVDMGTSRDHLLEFQDAVRTLSNLPVRTHP